MGKRRLRHPVGQGAWSTLAVVAMMVVLGALPRFASGGQQGAIVAAECFNYGKGLPSGWEPVEPLTAQSQVGQVLYEKRTPAMIAFRLVRLPGATAKFQLATTAMWANASNMAGQAAKTNVAGIGLRFNLRELEAPVYVPLVMDVFDIVAEDGQQVRTVQFEYVQQLVLLVPPEDLPRRMKVTGVAPGAGLVLTFFTAPEGYALRGALADIWSGYGQPPTIPPAKLCALTEKYMGDQVFNMGGHTGASIDIMHACEAGAHQSIPVEMQPAFIADFPAEGSMSAPKPFQIRLNQCSAFARPQVKFRAKSGLVPGTDSVLALYDTPANSEKPAQGFGVVVVDSDDRRIRFGPVGGAYGPQYPMTTQGGGAHLSLAARYIRTAGNRQDVESGVANAAAEFTFEFP